MLKDKTALITGASRGIGKAIAQQFSIQDCFVGINYVKDTTSAQETLSSLKNTRKSGMLLKGDVSNSEDIKQIVDQLVEKRNQIDILVHNAGIYKRHHFKDITLKDWNKVLDVNLNATFLLTKEVLPFMKKGSRIIFISSQLAFKGRSTGSDYATSKAGMLGLMRSLSLDLAEEEILVNAIAPGTIDTDIIADYTKAQRIQRENEIPLKRLGNPEDIANVAVFLASDFSNYITGETINVNGGLYIH